MEDYNKPYKDHYLLIKVVKQVIQPEIIDNIWKFSSEAKELKQFFKGIQK